MKRSYFGVIIIMICLPKAVEAAGEVPPTYLLGPSLILAFVGATFIHAGIIASRLSRRYWKVVPLTLVANLVSHSAVAIIHFMIWASFLYTSGMLLVGPNESWAVAVADIPAFFYSFFLFLLIEWLLLRIFLRKEGGKRLWGVCIRANIITQGLLPLWFFVYIQAQKLVGSQ